MSSRFQRRSGNSSRPGRSGSGRYGDNRTNPKNMSGKSSSNKRSKNNNSDHRYTTEKFDINPGPTSASDKRSSSFSLSDKSRFRSERSNDRRFGEKATFSRSKDDRRLSRSSAGQRYFSSRRADSASFQFRDRQSANPPEVEMFGTPESNDLIWGRHPTQAALESGRPIHRIWCTSELRSAPKFLRLLKDAKSSGVLVEEVAWSRLAFLTGGGVHQGIVLQTAAAETLDLDSLIRGCSSLDESPLLLALDGLTDPHNLGAIVRSAEALGAHGLVIPQRRSAGLTGSVAKVAAGALEHLPVARVVNLNRSLETLKKEGFRVIGLAEEGDETLSEVDLEGPLVVVTGSEDKGLSLLTRRHCDHLVRIPLRGVTPSLNASVATAMMLYEVARRGWMKDVLGQAPSPRIERAKYLSVDKNKNDNCE